MACDCHPQTDLCDSCTELLATGAEQERERIIALLEKHYDGRPLQRELYALIKGENDA